MSVAPVGFPRTGGTPRASGTGFYSGRPTAGNSPWRRRAPRGVVRAQTSVGRSPPWARVRCPIRAAGQVVASGEQVAGHRVGRSWSCPRWCWPAWRSRCRSSASGRRTWLVRRRSRHPTTWCCAPRRRGQCHARVWGGRRRRWSRSRRYAGPTPSSCPGCAPPVTAPAAVLAELRGAAVVLADAGGGVQLHADPFWCVLGRFGDHQGLVGDVRAAAGSAPSARG